MTTNTSPGIRVIKGPDDALYASLDDVIEWLHQCSALFTSEEHQIATGALALELTDFWVEAANRRLQEGR